MIDFKKVKELVITDLLQSNRQANQNNKKNKVGRSNLWWRVLWQNVLYLFMYGIFLGTTIFNIPLQNFPGMYTGTIAFMVLFIFLQVFQLIFNLFYDEEVTLSGYLPLPFSLSELFLSKIVTILLNTFALLLLPFAFMVMLGVQAGANLLYVIIVALMSTVLIMTVIILLTLTLVHLLHKIPLYVKYKRVATIILYLGMFAVLFYILYSNDSNMVLEENLLDTTPNPLFLNFYEMFVPGNYLSGWTKFGGWLALGGSLLVYTFKGIIPALYSDEGKVPAKRKRKKTKKTRETGLRPYRSKGQVFLRYQFRQLQDTTFIMQLFFSKLYFPFIFLAPAIIEGDMYSLAFLSELSHFWGLYILIGFVFSLVIISEASVPGVIISFDKENYHYMKSIPMSFKEYMRNKFIFAYVLEWVMGAGILSIIAFYLKPPVSVYINLLIGLTLGTYMMASYYFMRDYRLLNLDWNNFTELIQRGMNQFIRMLLTFIIFLLTLLGLMGLSFWLFAQNNPMLTFGISTLIVILLLLASYGIYTYANKKFWINFEQ